MVPELEKPRVTEVNVRMDCNGCVQKIKKALHGINGIYDLYIDFPQQKITIIGWADPEKIVNAIKKKRKIATICSHTEPQPTDPPAQPTEPADEGQQPEAANPPAKEAPPQAETPLVETPKEPSPPENPPPETKQPTAPTEATESQPAQPSKRKDVEEVHVIYHHPPDHGYGHSYSHGHGEQWNNHPNGPEIRREPAAPGLPPVHVTHSYNTYRPTPYVTEYVQSYNAYRPMPCVTECEYMRSPPQYYAHYSRPEHYNEEYYYSSNNGNGNVTSIFSDENPNACTIV